MKVLNPWKHKKAHAAPARIDDWFDRNWANPLRMFMPSVHLSPFFQQPSVDVFENKNKVIVKVEIPGMTEKDIDISCLDGTLTITGQKKDEKEDRKNNRYYRECSYGSFSRDIYIGDSVDWSKAQAKYKNGVLSVSFPKTEKAKKSIEINVN